ncbi:MAG: tandem-95 repeat protein, partial [Anaerolineae bacterium]|nr:tandem-95 repeat protein [Anaerolineae bacterium]
EAADEGSASLVEAAIDDVVIAAQGINQAPVGNPQSVSTAEDAPLNVLLTGSDPEDDPLTYHVVLSPTHGALTGTAPSLTYTPAPDYYGPDSFSFVANDGHSSSAPAEVSIDVTAVNDAPVAHPESVSTAEDVPLGVVLSGSDVDGDPLTYRVVLSPTHGTLSGTPPSLIYSPHADYHGLDSLAFTVDDGQASSEPAEVTIEVTAVNDVPVANGLSVAAAEDTPLDVVLTGSDVDGDPLTYRVVLTPSHGTLTGTAPSLSYLPAPDYHGADSLIFVAHDGTADSEPAAVTITITPVNDAPVAVPLTITARPRIPVAIILGGWDVDGDTLAYRIVTAPRHGTLTGIAPNLAYMPDPGYTGPDSFTFVVDDRELESAVVEVRITILFTVYVPLVVK